MVGRHFITFLHLQLVTQLVRQLYARDSRHRFCPEGHWLSPRAAINEEHVRVEQFVEESEVVPENTPKPGLSTISARSLAVLKFIPFAIPFLQRVRVISPFFMYETNYFK